MPSCPRGKAMRPPATATVSRPEPRRSAPCGPSIGSPTGAERGRTSWLLRTSVRSHVVGADLVGAFGGSRSYLSLSVAPVRCPERAPDGGPSQHSRARRAARRDAGRLPRTGCAWLALRRLPFGACAVV